MSPALQAAFRLACTLPSRVVPARNVEVKKPKTLQEGSPEWRALDRQIRELKAQGLSHRQVAAILPCSSSTVSRHLRKKQRGRPRKQAIR